MRRAAYQCNMQHAIYRCNIQRAISMQHAARSISTQHATRNISMPTCGAQHINAACNAQLMNAPCSPRHVNATCNAQYANATCFPRRLRNMQHAHASLSRMHRYAHRTATPSDEAVAVLRSLLRCSRGVPAKTFGSPYPTSASRHAAGGTSLNAIGYLWSRGWGRPGTLSRTARYPAHGMNSRTRQRRRWRRRWCRRSGRARGRGLRCSPVASRNGQRAAGIPKARRCPACGTR
jgi:hypothetical protein